MKAVLLVNTGSPATHSRKDVKAFVGAMLSDPYVMMVPDWLRPVLVKGIILPLRQFSSTSHYSLIWDYKHKSSPLLYNMQQLAAKLGQHTSMPVEIAMRYGSPSITTALDLLTDHKPKIHEVIVMPMFPQYADSSYKTVVDELAGCFFNKPYPFRLKIIEPYFNHPAYIKCLADSIRPYLDEDFDCLVFSYHRLPLSHVEAGWRKGKEFDYVFQAKETVRLVLKELNLDFRKSRLVYSSAIGCKWFGPALDDTMKVLPDEGHKKIIVITPGFAVDNLETLYDVQLIARNIFLKNGGQKFTFIPCLNSSWDWVEGISKIIS